ncbi:ABC transporter substrate-binding protein [Staphylospora marina]|uniref:ABC transporter substrate-binding protein n=1 Tax=Staphylospora marina TaxID=2490858 RepID=UPI000F5BF1C7|nr:iron-siderophore ABC transporter substrate-binding protein [Staphylospora marina]
MFGTLRRWGVAALSAVVAMSLVACGKADEQPNAESGQDSSLTVQHAMGSTPIKGTPKRVVVLTNEGTEAVLSLGVKPVGAVKSWLGDPWYAHIKDQMQGVEVVGTESDINLEAIAALKPDLILGNKMRQEKWYSQLSQIAPTVFSETLRGDWKKNYELYAKALNKEQEGKDLIGKFDARIEELKGKLGDKLNTKVSIVRFMPGSARIYQKDSFSGIILDQLGFKRTPSQDKPDFAEEVTKERIPDMDGDIIFYLTYDPDNEGNGLKTEQEWTADPLWKNLGAVKAGKAHKVDDAIWNTAGGILAAHKMLDDIESFFLK